MIKRNPAAVAAPTKTFGDRMSNVAVATPERVDAQVWLNIGYETGDEEYPVVTLPFGIAVDTMKTLAIPRGKNEKYLEFVQRRNLLLEEIQNAADALAPGEDVTIGGTEGGLILQLRRREGEAAEATAPAEDGYFPAFALKFG